MVELVKLRPVLEGDLETMRRFSLEPDALGEYQWSGFSDPNVVRRRWEEDGLLGSDSSIFAVVLPDGTFIGCISWRTASATPTRGAWVAPRPPMVACLEIGIVLLPEHRSRGYGTAAQRQLAESLFLTTPVHRIQATTETGNTAEQRALEKAGFQREGVLREIGFRAGRWVDGVLYSLLRTDPRPA